MSSSSTNSINKNGNKPAYRSAFNGGYRSSISVEKETIKEPSVSKSCDKNDINTGKESISTFEGGNEDSGPVKFIPKKHEGYVGFANLPNQIYWKAAKRGFELTLMVVGASGLGKSTLINSLFLAEVYDPETYPGPTFRSKRTISIETTRVKLRESGVNLTLTLVDTPGFGDSINNSECWTPIIEFIENKYEDFFVSESKVNRRPMLDQRIHCCLYFIQPSGHSLKQLDIVVLKHLSDKVNIIPIIAKADTLTPDEVVAFKKQILKDIEENGIQIYQFPDVPEDDEEHELIKSLKERVPFAVVGSNTVNEVDGKNIRGRKYPWGIVDITSLEHCDFIALRKMVLCTHMQDLKDTTHNIHYENYRFKKLTSLRGEVKNMNINPFLYFEEEKKNQEVKLKKMEAELEEVLREKVKKKEKGLNDTEKLLKMRFETTKKALEEEAKELEEKRKLFELEKRAWEQEVFGVCAKNQKGGLGSSKESIESKKKKRGLF